MACPAFGDLIKTHKWIREYENIELKGMINVVDGARGRSKNLVFMYREDKMFDATVKGGGSPPPKGNGIICVVGSLGQVAWYDKMTNEPNVIDCSLIDADHDGSLDCLVTDEYSQLGCINPVSGQWLWHVHNSGHSNVRNNHLLDFPLLLPDLNGDGVNDLLMASSLDGSRHNNLMLISGTDGQSIGQSYAVAECDYIHKLSIDSKMMISFNCVNNDSELEKFKPLGELLTQSINANKTFNVNIPPFNLQQHKFYGQRKNTNSQRNIYSVSGKQLIVENRGTCPDDCDVQVSLIDQQKSTVLSNASSTYGMVPTSMSFNKTKVDGRSAVHGFVIKFWEWLPQNETSSTTRPKRADSPWTGEKEFNIFGNLLVRQKRWIMPGAARRPQREIERDNYTPPTPRMRFIKETIILIVFNSTDTRIVNTSQSNIVQFCREVNSTMVCQPDLNYQENSLYVADLDRDGSQELVSYFTTFVSSEDTAPSTSTTDSSGGQAVSKNQWNLITYVQLLRLEAELPQLYETENNQ